MNAPKQKSRERNLVKANQMIRDRSDLPKSLQEETARLYRRLSGDGFVTGRSIAESQHVPLLGCTRGKST